MPSTDSPLAADWFVVSLRWLALLGLAISLSLGNTLLAVPNLLLVGLAIWNIVMTLLAGLGRRLAWHRQLSVGVDLLFSCAYFILVGGFSSLACWIVFLPLISAAFYFGILGAFIAATIMAILQVVVTLFQTTALLPLVIMGISVVLTFFLAGLFGYLGIRLNRVIHHDRQTKLEVQEQKTNNANERLRAIYNLTTTLTATLNYQRVLDSLLDISLTALNPTPDDRSVSAVLLFSKDAILEVGSARRLAPADFRVIVKGKAGALAQSIEQDKPILLQDVQHDPELTHFISFQACKEIYCFPLRSGFNAYGVLLFGHPEPGYFTVDRREVLDILGSQAVIAIQNARLYQDVVDERERMIEVQEEARKRLARDLHDGPTQSVAAIAMRVNLARRMMEKDPSAASEELTHIEDLARRTSKEIRHMLFTLRPLALESQGLVAALQSMAQKMKETYSQNMTVSMSEDILKDMEMGKQGVIFYIVEEAANNARKHAHAEHIWVHLRTIEKDIALLEIRDNGVGFDVEAVMRTYDQRGSLGMVNLQERTELVNGVLNLQSIPGKGTRVQVYIPLTEEAADRLHHATGKR